MTPTQSTTRTVMPHHSVSSYVTNVHHYRHRVSPADVQDCLDNVMEAIRNPRQPVAAAILGTGQTINPQDKPREPENAQFPRVPFEWRIAHVEESLLTRRVWQWRYDACGGKKEYDQQEGKYLKFIRDGNFRDPRQGKRVRPPRALGRISNELPVRSRPTFEPLAKQARPEDMNISQEYQGQLKRRSGETTESEESSPSTKRLSYTSQSSTASSLMAPSPTLGRAGAGPPRHQQHYPPTAGRGHRGSQAQHLAPPPFRPPSRLQSMRPMMAHTSQSAPLRNLPSISSLADFPETQDTGYQLPYEQQKESQSSRLALLAGLALGQQSRRASSGGYGDTAHTTGQSTQYSGAYQVLPPVWSGYGTSQYPSNTGGSQYGGTSASPATTQYQASQSVGRVYRSRPPAPMPTTAPTGSDVSQYLESQPGSSSGGRGYPTSLPPSSSAVGTSGIDPMEFEVTSTSSSSAHAWWDEIGEQMRSTEPNPWKLSDYQRHHRGGSGSQHG